MYSFNRFISIKKWTKSGGRTSTSPFAGLSSNTSPMVFPTTSRAGKHRCTVNKTVLPFVATAVDGARLDGSFLARKAVMWHATGAAESDVRGAEALEAERVLPTLPRGRGRRVVAAVSACHPVRARQRRGQAGQPVQALIRAVHIVDAISVATKTERGARAVLPCLSSSAVPTLVRLAHTTAAKTLSSVSTACSGAPTPTERR
jgi:hypothetical protein